MDRPTDKNQETNDSSFHFRTLVLLQWRFALKIWVGQAGNMIRCLSVILSLEVRLRHRMPVEVHEKFANNKLTNKELTHNNLTY